MDTKPLVLIDDELYSLLKSWGLSDYYMYLKEANINTEALKYLTPEDINELFPRFEYIGPRAIFRSRLMQWRSQLDDYSSDCSGNIAPPMQQITFSPITIPVQQAPRHDEDKINVKKILELTCKGQSVLDNYAVNRKLTLKQIQQIVNCVIDTYTVQRPKLSSTDFLEIRDKILELFPTESAEVFFKPSHGKNRAGGKLYDRYFNNKTKSKIVKRCYERKNDDSTSDLNEENTLVSNDND